MRRTLLVATAVLALLAGRCSNEDEPERRETERGKPTESTPPADFTPPHGTRWVGANDVALAAPRRWRIDREPACGRPDGGIVTLEVDDLGLIIDCADYATRGVPHLALDPSGDLRGINRECRADPIVTVLTVEQCGVRCPPTAGGACILHFATDGLSGRIVTYGEQRRRDALGLLRSITPVPDGFTTVPGLGYGVDAGAAQQLLIDAGLDGAIQSGGRRSALAFYPSMGTVVPNGTQITVLTSPR